MFMTFYGEQRGDKHTHEHAHESPAVMTIPLGVLALGSIFAGMLWYGSFFGDHDQVNDFFGIPHHAEAAADGHAPAADDHGDDHAAPADDHAAPMAHGEAPQGAIFMHPDNHVMDEAHHAPTWVKLSPFVAMILASSRPSGSTS